MRRVLLVVVVALVSASALATPRAAHANGRFPEANQLVFSASDPDLVLLRVTFGLLISHDRGKTFAWVCEQSIGYAGDEDPMYAATPNAIIGSTFQGVSISRTAACDWSLVGGDLEKRVFVDLAKSSNRIVAFSSVFDKRIDGGSALFSSRIWETTNEGATWTALGGSAPIPIDPTVLGTTIDLTATDPQRIYMTVVRTPGISPGNALLLVSKDHGQTWSEEAIALEGTEHSAFLAGVDPNNAERVYIRTANRAGKPGRLIVRDHPPNEQQPSQRVIFTGQGPLLGFAVARDGSKIWIGGPKDGVNIASRVDYAFTHVSNLDVRCLATTSSHEDDDGVLWACSTEAGGGFAAGVSKDNGSTFEPRLHFCKIKGPLACAGATCAPLWPAQRTALGCSEETANDAGIDAGIADGGVGQQQQQQQPPLTSRGSGCNATWNDAAPWGAGAVATAAAAAIAFSRRRRRRL